VRGHERLGRSSSGGEFAGCQQGIGAEVEGLWRRDLEEETDRGG